MKYILLSLIVLLSGCSTTVPVIAKFPDIPPALLEKCVSLKTLDLPEVSIVDYTKVVTENYTRYFECANKVEAWQEWHNTQKKLYESFKK